MPPNDAGDAVGVPTVAVPIGRYVLDYSAHEGSFALFDPHGESANSGAIADALATADSGDEARAGELLDQVVEDASTVTRRCERCVRLFNEIAQGKGFDPKVVSDELDSLLGLLARLDRANRHEEALRLARDLAALLALFLRWLDLVRSLELALHTARELGDGEAEAWALHELGSLHLVAGDPAGASERLNEALRRRDEIGGYGRCISRHNLDAARRDTAEVDALSRAQRRRRLRIVGSGAVLALFLGGGLAAAIVPRPHHHSPPVTSMASTGPPEETSTAHTSSRGTTTSGTATSTPTATSKTTSTQPTSTTGTTTPFVDNVAPEVTLTSPKAGSYIDVSTPTFAGRAGVAPGDKPTVTINLYSGNSTSGAPAASPTGSRDPSSGLYTVTLTDPIPDGTYTVQVEQRDARNVGVSKPAATFIVDTTEPAVTVISPRENQTMSPTPKFSGTIGTDQGDLAAVTVEIFPTACGTKPTAGQIVKTLQATVSNSTSTWSAAMTAPDKLDALPPGQTYTARAIQLDEAQNQGVSDRHFAVKGLATSPPPC